MAATDVFEFKADLREFAKHLDIALEVVIRRVALDLWNRIVLKTPVDTGRARAGWIISIGEMSNWKPDETNHGAPAMPDVSGITADDKVYILNNVEYIGALEEGSSKQAPAGMLRLSIAEVEVEIETIMLT